MGMLRFFSKERNVQRKQSIVCPLIHPSTTASYSPKSNGPLSDPPNLLPLRPFRGSSTVYKIAWKNFKSTFVTWFRMTSKQRKSPSWSGFDAFWICLLTRATGTFYLISLRSYCKPKQSNNCVCEVCNESVTVQAYSYHKMSSQFLFSRTCQQKLLGQFPWNFTWIPLWRLFEGSSRRFLNFNLNP